jgi:hypothetical protein
MDRKGGKPDSGRRQTKKEMLRNSSVFHHKKKENVGQNRTEILEMK